MLIIASGCSNKLKNEINNTVEAVLLGIAQDAGIPQIGCYCANCKPKQDGLEQKEFVASLGIIDHENKQYWIIDATPNLPDQLNALKKRTTEYKLAGVMLTHAHIGHYTGLMYLGKEAMGAKKVPIYVTNRFAYYLKNNGPWSQLVRIENIEINEVAPDTIISLSNSVKISFILVPHRDEFSDTVAIIVRGKNKSLLYCPDTDTWDKWRTPVKEVISEVDIALIDGSFYSPDEIKHRDFKQIQHPIIKDSIELFKDLKKEIIFIHLNHTNPAYRKETEEELIKNPNTRIGRFGDSWKL